MMNMKLERVLKAMEQEKPCQEGQGHPLINGKTNEIKNNLKHLKTCSFFRSVRPNTHDQSVIWKIEVGTVYHSNVAGVRKNGPNDFEKC